MHSVQHSYLIDIDDTNCIYLCINNAASLNYVNVIRNFLTQKIFWYFKNILYNFLNYVFFNALLIRNKFLSGSF